MKPPLLAEFSNTTVPCARPLATAPMLIRLAISCFFMLWLPYRGCCFVRLNNQIPAAPSPANASVPGSGDGINRFPSQPVRFIGGVGGGFGLPVLLRNSAVWPASTPALIAAE